MLVPFVIAQAANLVDWWTTTAMMRIPGSAEANPALLWLAGVVGMSAAVALAKSSTMALLAGVAVIGRHAALGRVRARPRYCAVMLWGIAAALVCVALNNAALWLFLATR
jgi:hypothetical protein